MPNRGLVLLLLFLAVFVIVIALRLGGLPFALLAGKGSRIAPGTIIAGSSPVTLPSGTTVEFIGISGASPFAGQPWWQPNGTVLAGPPVSADYDYPVALYDYPHSRTLAFRISHYTKDITLQHQNIPVVSMRQVVLTPTSRLVFLDLGIYKPTTPIDFDLQISVPPGRQWQH